MPHATKVRRVAKLVWTGVPDLRVINSPASPPICTPDRTFANETLTLTLRLPVFTTSFLALAL